MTYIFELGNHTEQAHDYTSELIDEAYRRKTEGPTTAQERVQKADELCEAHYAQIGQWPSEGILSRLAWYIVFDEMTDGNPHKVSAEEFPILSESQYRTRLNREKSISNVYTGENDETIGRYTDENGVKRRIYDYMTPKRDMSLVPTKYLDLYNAIDNAGLTERQRQAIELVYFEGMTQEDAAKEMGVGQDVISRHVSAGLRKLNDYMTKS